MAIELKTYGDLKKVINAIKSGNKKEMILSKGKEIALDTLLGFIGAGGVKSGVDLARAAFRAPDTKKTNTWLDRLNIDDEVSKIVDDTVENGYVDSLSKELEQKPDNEALPADFDINKELQAYLAQNYKNRTVTGLKEDKKIVLKLKKEISVTGTGASVTPGINSGVATKYSFGKTNKSKPEGWTDAPSIPNRKSKAMDYKELWEDFKVGDKVTYLGHPGEITAVNKEMSGAITYNVSYDKGNGKTKASNIYNKDGEIKPLEETLQEGYAQFKNSTKTRTKPEQFHQAVKEVKKKVNEINRLFEYMDRLKSELNEGEELKYKKYTERSIQQIKESTKQLFFKSTKLK
jgi:hypothetical protein